MIARARRVDASTHAVRIVVLLTMVATLLTGTAAAQQAPPDPDAPPADTVPAQSDGGPEDAPAEVPEPEVVPEAVPELPSPTTPAPDDASGAALAASAAATSFSCHDGGGSGGTGGPGNGSECASMLETLTSAGCTVTHDDAPSGSPEDTLHVTGCPDGVDPGELIGGDPDDPQACDPDANPIPLADTRGLPPEFVTDIGPTSQVLYMDVPKRDGFYATAVWDELILPLSVVEDLEDLVTDLLPGTGIPFIDDLLIDEATRLLVELLDEIDELAEADDDLVLPNGDLVIGRYLVRSEYSVKDGRIQDAYTVSSTPEFTVIGRLFTAVVSESEVDNVTAGGEQLLVEHKVDVRLQVPVDVPSGVIDLPELRAESDVTIRNFVEFSDWTATSDGADAYTVLALSRCPE